MSKGKKRIVRLNESEMVNLIEKIVKIAKREEAILKESKREETRRRVMAEANRPIPTRKPSQKRK